ncbi:MAG: peptide transporter [Pseudomonadota bacterium]
MASAESNLLADLERKVATAPPAAALASLIKLLRWFSGSAGRLPPGIDLQPVFGRCRDQEAATRIAAAISELFCRADLALDQRQTGELIALQRWIAMCFAASSFGNADHLLARLRLVPSTEWMAAAPLQDIAKMAVLYGPESRLPLDFSQMFLRAPGLACSLAVALLSGRLLATPTAHRKREILLKWLPEALARLGSIAMLPQAILVDLWMHSSYGLERGKHDVKKPLNALIRRQIEAAGIRDVAQRPAPAARPTVFVMLEWFHKSHSIMRTHSISMKTLRDHYRLVGFGPKGMVDEVGQSAFDEFHYFDDVSPDLGFLKKVVDAADRQQPIATYYPSVGMGLHSLYLVNARLAPTQVIALGHPATTHSDKIDYVVVEEDYVGDPALFSETVVPVPRNALPYFEPAIKLNPPPRKAGSPVRIAVPAAAMKLNPVFLSACRKIVETARTEVEFHFLLGGSPDLMHAWAEKAITAQVPDCVVHKTAPVPEYLANVAACDLFANPFPFGNTNGIVDTVYCGLPGVCLSGDEVHAHIDEGMFRRMSFPDWTIARTIEDYVAAVVRLVDDEALRSDLGARLRAERWDKVLYQGKPEAFAEIFRSLVERRRGTMPSQTVA